MSMHLSSEEAKLILRARKYARLQFWSIHVVLGAILFSYFAANFELISTWVFSTLTLSFAFSYLLSLHINRYPSYEHLLALLEQKVSESSDAIQALSAIKNGPEPQDRSAIS